MPEYLPFILSIEFIFHMRKVVISIHFVVTVSNFVTCQTSLLTLSTHPSLAAGTFSILPLLTQIIRISASFFYVPSAW